ncbi:putative acyl-lipid (11-3)-desaturase [Helianthus annuus]|nr:putative acyl-lipid (11-3)-desaturase [Helianthus annuus]KAJ0545383.1 putative acyl-lipid (11-3)-desaturase [Helianthus annuus]KAJ0721273.1 putative acyl-lipid (11-3)-desaturase [Helianthus annuus]KAJ0747976.1 putative acyl-lipid (11-3)-desaturase [Helianthus annuus]
MTFWILILGKVYNVTEWAKEDPAGATPFVNLAGQDVTDLLITFHPGTAWKHLDKLFTGYHLKSLWVHMLSGAILGLAWMQIAYLGHDVGPYQMMATRGWKTFAGIFIGNCITGISITWWKWTHNAHHIACNSLGYDPDLQHLPMFIVSSKLFNSVTSVFYGRQLTFDPLARFFVSYQHYLFCRP